MRHSIRNTPPDTGVITNIGQGQILSAAPTRRNTTSSSAAGLVDFVSIT